MSLVVLTRMLPDRLPRMGQELAWILAGQTAAVIGGFVGIRLLTEYLAPASYGQLALATTLATVGSQVVLGPLNQSSLRYFAPAQEVGSLSSFFGAIKYLIVRASSLILTIGLPASLVLWLLVGRQWFLLSVTALAMALVSGYGSILDGVQNAARQRVVVAWHQALSQWLRPLIAVFLLVAIGAKSHVAMLGYVVAAGAVFISQMFFFRRKIVRLASGRPDTLEIKHLTRQMWAYALPFCLWGVFTWSQMSADRWALQVFWGASTVGLYAVLCQLGYYPMDLLGGIVSQLAAPILFAHVGDGKNRDRVMSALRFNVLIVVGMSVLTVLFVLVGMLLHGTFFSILTAEEYRSKSYLLPLAILMGGLFNVGQLAALLPMTLSNSRALLAPKIGGACLSVGLSFGGAYLAGIQGVLVAGILARAVQAIWLVWVGIRLSPAHIVVERIQVC